LAGLTMIDTSLEKESAIAENPTGCLERACFSFHHDR
jgi:hypothetical protein